MKKYNFILDFEKISIKKVKLVGGKNASLGEIYNCLKKYKIQVPDGFALTTKAYWYFIKKNKIDKDLKEIFSKFDPKSLKSLQETGKKARNLILRADFPKDLKNEIFSAYENLSKKYKVENLSCAVRSSGVAEDAPQMSFAGQFETFLNVSGKENLLQAIKKCLASAFGERVIAYRQEKKVPHLKFALSVGIQKMVRSDLASSGVMFTLDTETGFPNVVLIHSIYGVGEMIVKGKIIPDEFLVFKPTLLKGYKAIIAKNLGKKKKKYIYKKDGGLKEVKVPKKDQEKFSLTEDEVLQLAKWGILIERHYKRAQDIEWAKDGELNQLFIVQSRPETVHFPKLKTFFEDYQIKTTKKPILVGVAVGNKIGQGKVRIIPNVKKISEFQKGEVLVTKMTDPDWVPAIRIASAVITEEGGRTCHAAIVSRELGVPCIVGVQGAMKTLKTGQQVTVDCSSGKKGRIFLGKIPFFVKKYNLKKIPKLPVNVTLNIGSPEIAFKYASLPVDGVGLAREEFIIAEKIRIHPLALYHFNELKDKKLKMLIEKLTAGYKDKRQYFIDELAEGISQIAAAFYPKEVIVRFSDFKSNEYRALIGGEIFEPEEENPMLGWRGASRYYDEKFQPAFEMEVKAIKKAREEFGLKNISVMIPFCRTVEEAKKVLILMKKFGLERKKGGLKVYLMCEIPSNVILAEKFLKLVDGYSIGSNDLTQCILGIDRDNAKISQVGNEFNEAVKISLKKVIEVCNTMKKYSGICGEAGSIPSFAKFLVKAKIKSISVNPEMALRVITELQKVDKF